MNRCFPSSCAAHHISVWNHVLVMTNEFLSQACVYIQEQIVQKVHSDLVMLSLYALRLVSIRCYSECKNPPTVCGDLSQRLSLNLYVTVLFNTELIRCFHVNALNFKKLYNIFLKNISYLLITLKLLRCDLVFMLFLQESLGK